VRLGQELLVTEDMDERRELASESGSSINSIGSGSVTKQTKLWSNFVVRILIGVVLNERGLGWCKICWTYRDISGLYIYLYL
jgi:hypothetical protein